MTTGFPALEPNYTTYIQKLAQEQSPSAFYNSTAEQGTIVMATIFRNATKYVKIYASCFSGEISGNQFYRDALQELLSRGVEVKISLDKDQFNDLKHNPPLYQLFKLYEIIKPGQVQIKLREKNIISNDTKQPVHFTVSDDRMYRLETDTIKFTAEGSFNDEKRSKSLSGLFDIVFNENSIETNFTTFNPNSKATKLANA